MKTIFGKWYSRREDLFRQWLNEYIEQCSNGKDFHTLFESNKLTLSLLDEQEYLTWGITRFLSEVWPTLFNKYLSNDPTSKEYVKLVKEVWIRSAKWKNETYKEYITTKNLMQKLPESKRVFLDKILEMSWRDARSMLMIKSAVL